MAKLNLDKFKENADRIIQEKSTLGLFSESQNKLLTLELELLEDNPFPINLNNSDFDTLCESIENFGQLEPIIVFKSKNGYQILDGHARKNALIKNAAESALCMEINISKEDAIYYPYFLNQSAKLDTFEIAYYLDRLITSGISTKNIQKKLGLTIADFTKYNFEYNLFDILKSNDAIEYANLVEISQISDETLRDETLDHIVQKLINQTEIANYLLKIKENALGSKFLFKRDGIKIKKSSYKISIDVDERYLTQEEIKKVYEFITSF